MRDKNLIKQLGKTALTESGEINKTIIDFVLNKLDKSELKIFLQALKSAYNKRNVFIRYAGTLSSADKKMLESMFPQKRVNFINDKSISGGIAIQDNDMILNYTIEGLITNKLHQAKLE